MTDTIRKTLWLVLQPKQSSWDKSQGRVRDVAVEGVYVQKPRTVKAGLMIELKLELDEGLFQPIVPNAVIKIEKDTQAEEAAVQITGTRVRAKSAPKPTEP